MIRLGVLSLDHPHASGNHFPALRCLKNRVSIAAIAHENRSQAEPWLEAFQADYCFHRDDLLARDDIDAVLVTS